MSILLQIFVGMALASVMWAVVGFSLTFGDTLGGSGLLGDPRQYAFHRGVHLHKPYNTQIIPDRSRWQQCELWLPANWSTSALQRR